MNNKLLLIITLLICSFSNAQISFKGIVTEDDTSKNVTDAIVAIEGTTVAQLTDLNGAFNFLKTIPIGDQVVTITKKGYVTKYLLIEVVPGKNIIMDNVKIEVNKKERKRREKVIKAKKKEVKKAQKERDDFVTDSKKEKKKKEKALEKQRKKLQKKKKKNKDTEDIPVYENNTPINTNVSSTEVTSLQIKFGSKLNVTPETISNSKLYEFINLWEGTKYILGGETEEGIDCSSFTQRLYIAVYNVYLERTAQKQFDSKLTDKFLGKDFLREGDLIFFKGSGENKNTISHVGIYLHNGYFVHATSYTKDNGLSGVKISNLSNAFWTRRFVAGGRRQKN